MQNLEVLDLSWNKFEGSFPLHIHLPRIRILDVSENNLVGSLTSTICDRSQSIESLNFAENWFHGEVPVNFGNCTSLLRLFLNGNSLSGSLPERLFQLEHLRELQFQDNGFSGPLDERIDNLSNVVKIDLSRNLFSGVLPDVFRSLPKLEHFAARSNKFSGQLPPSLMSSPSLSTLDLNNNTLDGRIIINCSSMARLTSLDLGSNLFRGNNSFTGDIPRSLSELRNCINSSRSFPAGSLSNVPLLLGKGDGKFLTYNQFWSLPSTLDLSYNKLTGPIWPSFGNLKGLQAFYLENNQLSGHIPNSLSEMQSLERLGLSHNGLTGEIPASFQKLTFLSAFDVSYNKLSGTVPSGGQFSTFPDSSFEGNIGLCGSRPSLPSCQSQPPSDELPNDEASTEGTAYSQMAFGIGAAVGFIWTVSLCFLSGWVLDEGQRSR
ncbi:hypothetical protein NL676_015956 [Syzygium grande]|nr:hypothetical protein NL676_015956 [Syzygium grande]